jgi:hypothetical protein
MDHKTTMCALYLKTAHWFVEMSPRGFLPSLAPSSVAKESDAFEAS